MTTQQIERALYRTLIWFRRRAPYDTGNLSGNAIKLERVGVGVWRLYVDMEVAPYMPYTNEPWVSPKWHGKQNPNQAWWNKAVKEFMRRVGAMLGGKIDNV